MSETTIRARTVSHSGGTESAGETFLSIPQLATELAGDATALASLGITGKAPIPVAGGAAATTGEVVLVGGTKDVATTAAGATSHIFFQEKTAGGTPGTGQTYTVNNGVGFTITSNNALDTSTYSWFIVNA